MISGVSYLNISNVMETKEFLSRMKKNDMTLIDDLYPEIRIITFKVCSKLNIVESLQEEVVQEVALKVYRQGASFKGRSKLSSWIYQIGFRHCLDELRKLQKQKKAYSTSSNKYDDQQDMLDNVSDRSASHFEDYLAKQEALTALNNVPATRNGGKTVAEILYWITEHSPNTKELASYLGTSESAAKERKSYIYKQVRAHFRKFCGHSVCSAE